MSDDTYTDSGIPIKRFYCQKDLGQRNAKNETESPGVEPYTRGIYAGMYRDKLWTMRQYTGFGNAEETNKRFKFLLQQGQSGLSLAFDLPTQLGYDSDSNKAKGEVGKVGVSVSSLEDMKTLFQGIHMEEISTSMTINATAPTLLGLYVATAESQGIDRRILKGTTQNDILKEYIARNTYIYPPRPSLRLQIDLIEYCTKNMPAWYPVSISGYHIREAGASAVQELGFTFSNAIEYVERVLERGLKIDEFASRLSFFLVSRNDFFEEIAKFRAARRIWYKIVKDRFEATRPESMKLRFHAQTSGETLTAQQPENNVVRVAVQTMAAVLGGAQSIHTNSRDEALSLPTEESAKIALRTQQILAHESGITKTADPLGGGYYIEYLTSKIEEEVWKLLDKIEQRGGALATIESGYVQNEIQTNAYKFQREVDQGTKTIVGVNKFGGDEKLNLKVHRVDPKVDEVQKKRVQLFKEKRDSKKVMENLRKLEKAASGDINMVPSIFQAIRDHATTGEISEVLRGIFGEYRARNQF